MTVPPRPDPALGRLILIVAAVLLIGCFQPWALVLLIPAAVGAGLAAVPRR